MSFYTIYCVVLYEACYGIVMFYKGQGILQAQLSAAVQEMSPRSSPLLGEAHGTERAAEIEPRNTPKLYIFFHLMFQGNFLFLLFSCTICKL